MDDEEDFQFFGTPIVDEQEGPSFQRHDPASTRGLPLHQQEERDDQGRQRFHGAFTGGYSAGYFNTVGSKEGWAPSAFKSSRQSRTEVSSQSVEQFLDEDELEEYRRRHLQTTAAYDTFGATAAEASRRAAWEAGAARPLPIPGLLPDDIIAPAPDGVGNAAEFEAAKAVRLAAARLGSGSTRRGPGARPRGVAFGTGVLDEDDAEGTLDDYVAHGEVGGEVESAEVDARGLPARRGAAIQRPGLGDRLAASGYSFEIQEEEEEEEDGGEGPLLLGLPGSRAPALLTARPHVHERGARPSIVPGFLPASHAVASPSYPAPRIPQGWAPRRRRAPAVHPPAGRAAPPPRVPPPADAKLRQVIDGLAFQVARSGGLFEGLARERQAVADGGTGYAFLRGGEGAEYYAWKLATLRDMLAPPGSRGRGRGAPSQPPPHAEPLSAEQRGSLLGETPLPPGPGGSGAGGEAPAAPPPPARQQRRSMLANVAAADRLRLAGMLSSNFVSGGKEGEDHGDVAAVAGLRRGAAPPPPPSAPAPEGPGSVALGPAPALPGSQPRAAGRIVTLADLSRPGEGPREAGGSPALPVRRSVEWAPVPLLCKRFDVPDPYQGRPRDAGAGHRSRADALALPDTAAAAVAAAAARLGPGMEGLLTPGTDAVPRPGFPPAHPDPGEGPSGDAGLDAEEFLASLLGDAGESAEEQPPLPPPPPMDLFKAIFEEEEEEEEDEKEEGGDGQAGPASAGDLAPPSGPAPVTFGFAKLAREAGPQAGLDEASRREQQDKEAKGLSGLDPKLRQRVEHTLRSLGKRERKEKKHSKEKRSKHHHSSKEKKHKSSKESRQKRSSRSDSE